jgi:RNA polymerase sigma-70 factor (ECF subfamily)
MFLRDRDPDSGEPAASGAADLELVRGVLRRDPAALAQFVARMQCVPRFVAFANARTGRKLSEEAVEDLVQDVIAAAWRRLADFRGDSRLETWVFRFCQFQLRNAVRRAAPRRAVSLSELGEIEGATAGSLDEHEEIGAALDRMPDDEARVLRLKHFDGLTFDEIAARLSASPNTIKTRYYRGLNNLRQHLRPDREGA